MTPTLNPTRFNRLELKIRPKFKNSPCRWSAGRYIWTYRGGARICAHKYIRTPMRGARICAPKLRTYVRTGVEWVDTPMRGVDRYAYACATYACATYACATYACATYACATYPHPTPMCDYPSEVARPPCRDRLSRLWRPISGPLGPFNLSCKQCCLKAFVSNVTTIEHCRI